MRRVKNWKLDNIRWAVIRLWNNTEIISGKFSCDEIKLFLTDVDEGRNNFITHVTKAQDKTQMHTRGRSRNKCCELFSTGVRAQSLQRGCFNSTALMSLPQRSHWSPRASSYAQSGQIPSTNRSARNLIHSAKCLSRYTCTTLTIIHETHFVGHNILSKLAFIKWDKICWQLSL